MKSLLLSIFLSFVGVCAYSQNYEVKGNVVDSNGSPLPGVSIVVKNTMKGASTDFDGNFTISNIVKGETLVFSFIGYTTKEIWWEAGIDEKVACCNCFYTAQFKFTKNANGTFTLNVNAPDGAFTKTGALTNLPGIPATGDEGCYSEYSTGTSSFNFVPASSGAPASTPSTQTSIKLADYNTYIGYGATLDEYEILAYTDSYMYLRVQGTETGNSWYIKLKPAA